MNLSLLAVAISCVLSAAAVPPQKPVWHTDYTQAREIARRQDKPLFAILR